MTFEVCQVTDSSIEVLQTIDADEMKFVGPVVYLVKDRTVIYHHVPCSAVQSIVRAKLPEVET